MLAIGTLIGAPLAGRLAAGEGPVIEAQTNRPDTGLFIPGEPVEIRLVVSGLGPNQGTVATVRFEDACGQDAGRLQIPVPAGTTTWTTTVPAPAKLLGYYRVRAELSTGATIPAQGNRSAGYITYAVVPDPAQRTRHPPERTYFGMQGGFNPAIAEVVPLLGVGWMMDNTFYWKDREPQRPGQFANPADPALEPRHSFGQYAVGSARRPWAVHPLFANVLNMPAWAKAHHPQVRQCALTPDGEAAFRAFCTTSAKANLRLHPELKQRIYEITWEPCIPWGFTGTPADIVRIHAIAHEAFHAVDPGALVIGPCLATMDRAGYQELEGLLQEGLGRYLDGYSVHPYHPQPSDQAGVVTRIREVKALLRRHTGRDLPLFGTEMGYGDHWGTPTKELEHARALIRQDLIMLGEGFRFNFAFYVHDMGKGPEVHDSGYGYMHNLTQTAYGAERVSPKPAAAAYAAMSWLLEGHTSTGAIEWMGDTAWGYAYEGDQDVILALWDWGGRPRTQAIPVGAAEIEVFDWMGNARRLTTQQGMATVTLGDEPIYLRGVARTLWGARAIRPIALAGDQPAAYPGAALELRGTVRPPLSGRDFRGQLLIEPDPASGLRRVAIPIQVAAGQEHPLAHRLSIPLDTAAGSYALRLTLVDGDGRGLAASGTRLDIRLPVAIERVVPLQKADGSRSLAVTVRDVQGSAQRGAVIARIHRVPESQMQAPLALAASGTATATLLQRDLMVEPWRRYTAEVGVRLDSGFVSTQTVQVGFLQAQRLAQPPAIDGALADWAGVPAVTLAGLDLVLRGHAHYRGPQQQAAVRLGWNDQALFVAVEARAVAQVPSDPSKNMPGSCVQIFCNPDHGRTQEKSGNGLADEGKKARFSGLTLALTTAGPVVWRHASAVPAHLPLGAVPAAEASLAVVRAEGATRYEAALAWRQLGMTHAPTAGESWGFALQVLDLGSPQQTEPAVLGLFDGSRPEGLGVLTLGEGR